MFTKAQAHRGFKLENAEKAGIQMIHPGALMCIHFQKSKVKKQVQLKPTTQQFPNGKIIIHA